MIELIYSFVYNGTIIGNELYTKWLPFYNYGIYIIGLILISFLSVVFMIKSLFMLSLSILVASLFSNVITYLITKLIPYNNPSDVFNYWTIGTIVFLLLILRGFDKVEFNSKTHNYRTKEEYFEHIKETHPDIWKEYMEKEDNGKF